ncbi:xanthine dehydrogenase family protein molybdopterin-binding subunit [soil metagenome]
MKTNATLNSSTRSHISRRNFLGQTGSFSFFLVAGSLLPKFVTAGNKEEAISEQKITAWVQLNKDGRITIYNPAAEMGQGSMTALAVVIAEEMDANWADVHIEDAPVIPETYGLAWSGKLGGPMMTVGSRTIRGYYPNLRQAGAQARYILLYNAAAKWGVPITELKTEPGIVIHSGSGRKMSYGEIAAFAKIPATIPEIAEKDLKQPANFRLIGHVIPRFDIPAKVNGSAQYGIDIQLPGMLYGVVSRSPVNGSKPELLNEQEVRETEGLVDIVKLDYGIGIIAETFEQALKAKKVLQIRWSAGAKASGYNSDLTYDTYHAMVKDDQPKGKLQLEKGNAAAAMKSAQKTYDLEYRNDYLCHAQLEPLNATVHVAADGKSAEAWAGTQAPDAERAEIAKALNIKDENVTLHTCYLGGGFGRRHGEFSSEAAILSNKVKRPVKLIWTREDDFQYGTFRPTCLQRMQAAVDQAGKLVAWQHYIAGPDERLQTGGTTMDYYGIPNQYVDLRLTDHGVRTTYWRSVGHGPNKFAQEAFLGEIAYDLKVDGYEFRRRLMQGLPRYLAILDKLKELSKWESPLSAGRSKGMAFSDYGGSYTAGVVEISLDRSSGKIKVHKVWLAVDAGVVVQPDNAKAQMEGGIVMGISSVLNERISFKNGKVQQSNFHDYPILRMADAPESIEISLIPSTEPPTSMGELSLPVMGGAIANAFLLLTGKSLRHMPFTTQKVLDALKA